MQRGDICLVEADPVAEHPQAGYASALNFSGQLWVIAPGDKGLQTLPADRAVRAWRVE